MPRIDPQQLLKCLSVLLSPKGGIKSQDEVQRLASLMTKFSKKLVSKCIYVSILKATETDLLVKFMSAGGWDLSFSWLSDGVAAKNWPLVIELVDLLLMCPVDIDRLKTNACPKLIKTLSKDLTADIRVRLLACRLVDQWLRVVRGDDVPATATKLSEPCSSKIGNTPQHPAPSCNVVACETEDAQDIVDVSSASDSEVKSDVAEEGADGNQKVYKITIRDGKNVLAEISGDHRSSVEDVEGASTVAQDSNQNDEDHVNERLNDCENDDDDEDDEDLIRPVKLKNKKPPINKINKRNRPRKPAKVYSVNKKDRESTDSSSSSGKSPIRQKETAKQTKKVKVEPVKTNVKGKPNSTISKSKETVKSGPTIVRKEKDESNNLKQKERFSLSLKNRTNTLAIRDRQKTEEKGKPVPEDNTLTDKEKESLLKFITPPISKVGKIPKKTSLTKEEKQSEDKTRTLKEDSNENKIESKKSYDVKKSEVKRPEKNYSISVEPKRSAINDSRPKTVKTYNSKFRSTGLEEEIRPPPPRTGVKKQASTLPPPTISSSLPDKKLVKRSSPPPENHIPEKKPKQESPPEDKKSIEKAGGIKLIPPKPKPMFLQESDVFMDAMLAANTLKEPRKRKRRGSVSKDSPIESKKEAGSPKSSPRNEEVSPSSIKPTFKFYQETMESSMEEEKDDITIKNETDSMEFSEPNNHNDMDENNSMSPSHERTAIKVEGSNENGSLKGVLVYAKSRRQKKSVSWKEDDLEAIKYFELDETERVNVTKNFADMKSMEREMERENVQIARKLAVDDVMEEKIRWKALIPIDIAAPIVAPGKNSQEKEIQYAREKTVAEAIYFSKRSIPDTPAEPDLEIHATTDPVSIPLDDITGSTDSINDFTKTVWPDPKGQPPPPPSQPLPPGPPMPVPAPGPFMPPGGPGPGPGFPQPGPPVFPPMGPFMPGPGMPGPGMPPMPGPGDCWRTADGKVVPITPEMFPPGMMPPGMPPMGPPGSIMLPPGVTPEMAFPMGMPLPGPGPNPTPEEMAQFGGFGPMGPPPPGMAPFCPPPPPPVPPPQGPGPQGGTWQGSGGSGNGGGNWYNEGDQPSGGGSSRYQGSNWRGGRGNRDGRNPDNNWGGGNSRTPVCNNYKRGGFCKHNNCRFRHPR